MGAPNSFSTGQLAQARVPRIELAVAWRRWTPWQVNADGQNIGTLDVSSSGNVLVFNDNPVTDHPPHTRGSWGLNYSGDGYGSGTGHTTYFFELPDGSYRWTK